MNPIEVVGFGIFEGVSDRYDTTHVQQFLLHVVCRPIFPVMGSGCRKCISEDFRSHLLV